MQTRVPFFSVKIAGQDVTRWVSAVSVTEHDREADSASVTIPDPRMIYADAFFEGSDMQIDLGYAESGQHALMLKAMVTKVDVSYPQDGVPSIKLKASDRSIEMGLQERRKSWRNTTVTGIVRTIGKKYFPKVEASLDKDRKLDRRAEQQDGKTDLAFLQALAKKYHAKCFVELDDHDNEVLYFIPERGVVRLRRPDTLVLTYRMGPKSNLISFSPTFDSTYVDRLKAVADLDDKGAAVKSKEDKPADPVVWKLNSDRMALADKEDKDRINALYQAGLQPMKDLHKKLAAHRVVVGEVVADQTHLDAQHDTLESRRLGMKANGTTFGTIWLRAKSNVKIHGVNERFLGDWYVSAVTHTIDDGGYKTDFDCER